MTMFRARIVPPDAPTNPSPADQKTDVTTTPSLQVTVTDPDNDNLDITFYWNDGSIIGTTTNIPSGTTNFTTTETDSGDTEDTESDEFPWTVLIVVLIVGGLISVALMYVYRKQQGD